MDSTLTLLKQEINQTLESEHDLLKWKLAVTAALGAAAFGLAEKALPRPWLLVCVPFVCAYIDLYAYQYQARIRVIARFLRLNPGGDWLLQKYEIECQRFRGMGIFSLGSRAGFGCSIGASVLGPIFYAAHNLNDIKGSIRLHAAGGAVWLVGVVLIISLWYSARAQTAKFENIDDQGAPRMAVPAPAA